MASPASYVHSTLRVRRQLRVDGPRQRRRAAELRPAIGRRGWRSLCGRCNHGHEERSASVAIFVTLDLLPAAPVPEIANSSLRLTMKSAPLAGTGVE